MFLNRAAILGFELKVTEVILSPTGISEIPSPKFKWNTPLLVEQHVGTPSISFYLKLCQLIFDI